LIIKKIKINKNKIAGKRLEIQQRKKIKTKKRPSLFLNNGCGR
jgi:hypothetical protein